MVAQQSEGVENTSEDPAEASEDSPDGRGDKSTGSSSASSCTIAARLLLSIECFVVARWWAVRSASRAQTGHISAP